MSAGPLVVRGVAFAPLDLKDDGGGGPGTHLFAKTPFGVYQVWRGRSGPAHANLKFNTSISATGISLCPVGTPEPATIEAAIALAQADYERRISELLAPPAQEGGWMIRLSDERDVCRVCSVLIGAVYNSAEDAAKRVNEKRAWGMSLWGDIRIERNSNVGTAG